MTQTVTLTFFRFDRWRDRLWAFVMMGAARPMMARVPHIGFWKLFGSGTGEGFSPKPNTRVFAILATWPDKETAQRALSTASVLLAYKRRASEFWTVFLSATSARGEWSGNQPFHSESETKSGPLAALTRASVRPARMLKFWQRVPDISKVIGGDQNVLFKIGVGEVPWLHQVTFSIWPETQSMAEFARKDGPHAQAIRAVREGDWFSEELYARFSILDDEGSWNGSSPLAGLKGTTA